MLDFFNEATDSEQLADWFVSVSLQEFENMLDSSEKAKLLTFLRQIVDQDPFLQTRLQWLATFLAREKND